MELDLSFWLSQLLNGLALGALLFLVGSGFSLIMGLMGIVNLAHGAFYLLGAYLAIALFALIDSFALAFLAGAIPVAVLGMAIERYMLRRFRHQELVQVLLTIGIWIVLADIMLAVWGGDVRSLPKPSLLAGSVGVIDFRIGTYRLSLIAVGVLVGLGLWYFESRTRLGAVVRAGVDDEEMVRGVGINIDRVFLGMVAFGSALAGAAGALGGAFLGAYPGLDGDVLLYAVIVVIVGGRGSLAGAAIAASLIGLVWNVSNALFPELTYFSLFAPVALFLAFRPQGLLGKA